MKNLIAVALLLVLSAPGFAWNDKGHMVVARLAWKQLTPEQRNKVAAVLKKHPHYAEFLAANKPEAWPEDEWVFMRAACWSDWVRNHHAQQFNHGPWHYINYPFVPPGSKLDPAKYEPPPSQENVVNVLTTCVEKIKSGSDEEKAVYLTWMFHLIGDMHQPLHCVAMYSETFPTGDQGGNLCRIRIRTGNPVNLHSFWDGLLGRGDTPGSIGKDVLEIEKLLEGNPTLVKDDLGAHKTFQSWAKEGADLAKKVVYLNGELKLSKASSSRGRGNPEENDVQEAPPEYASQAGRTARVQIGKAAIRLADQLAAIIP
jgi:S1/P1 Nuclease